MRKLILFLLLLFVHVTLSAQVIDNPKFKARAGNIYNIVRIERTDEATRLHIHAIFRPHWWIKMENNTYLEDAETGKRYAFTGAEGIELNKEVFMPESGQMDFVLIYEPLPCETTQIHCINPDYKAFNTYDISLVASDKKKASPLEAVHGNWFDCERGGWVIGIYDSVTIVNNRIYTNKQVRKRKKNIELTLQDKLDGQILTLLVALQRNGTCKLMQGENQHVLTRTSQQVEVLADNGYEHFFYADTALLQGYIEGYDTRLGFETGLVYLKHIATGRDFPTVVQIAPDGTFACKLPLQHPESLAVWIDEKYISFFIEPGQTQTMYISWEDLMARDRARDIYFPVPGIHFMGGSAHLSYLSKELGNLMTYDYSKLQNAQMTLTPAQFKESLVPSVNRWQQVADSLAIFYQASQKAVKLIRHSAALWEGQVCFDFAMNRSYYAYKNPDNEVLKVNTDENYYDFLHRMPIDDPEMLVWNMAHIFVNRFEFMDILRTVESGMEIDEGLTDEEVAEMYYTHQIVRKAKLDSLIERICGKANPFLWQLAGVRQIKSKMFGLGYAQRRAYIERQLQVLKEHPFLVSELEKVYAELQAEERTKSYELPEGKATDIFRNIIKEHAGKVLFIDFWGTTCGPCRAGIESTAELRRKYKDHPEFKFIYITGEYDSPKAAYDRYVEQHLKGEATYYLSGTEFNYLRELFKFNGIPHYELVEKDGTISIEHINTGCLFDYLQERFPLEE